MARSEEDWIKLHSVFNPNETLAGERGDRLYCEYADNPLPEIRLLFRNPQGLIRPPIVFFTGHRGSGKSSALIQMFEHCRTNFFAVYFDIQHNLDSSKANQVDLLYLIGAAIFKAAQDEGYKPDEKNLKALIESVYSITKTEKETGKSETFNAVELVKGMAVFTAGMLGANFAQKLADAALKPFSISSGVSEETVRKREIEPQIQDIITNINFIIADVQSNSAKPLLVIIDGLDKIQRKEQAELIFIQSQSLRGPLCSLIYTVPMLLYSSPLFPASTQECRTYLLPNVKLYEKKTETKRYDVGYEFMREITMKRLALLGLAEKDVFAADALDLLIAKSGGVIRWLMLLIQDSLFAAELMGAEIVSQEATVKAIDKNIADMSALIRGDSLEELRYTREHKRPSGNPKSDELLHGLLILAYRNRMTWYDVHPLLWDVLSEL